MSRFFYKDREKEFKIIAGALSSRTGVSIVRKGHIWQSDPTTNTIYIPTYFFYDDASLGALIHEAAHLKYSMMPVHTDESSTIWEDFKKTGKDVSQIKNLFNALEDFRIETKIVEDFPGAKFYIESAGTQNYGALLRNLAYMQIYKPQEFEEKYGFDPAMQFIISLYPMHHEGGGLFAGGYGRRHILNGERVLKGRYLIWNDAQFALEKIRSTMGDNGLYDSVINADTTEGVFEVMKKILPFYLPLCRDAETEGEKPDMSGIAKLLEELFELLKKRIERYRKEVEAAREEGESMAESFEGNKEEMEEMMAKFGFTKKDAMDMFLKEGDYSSHKKGISEEEVNERVEKLLPQMRDTISILKDLETTRYEDGFRSGKLVNRKLWKLPTGKTKVFSRRTGVQMDNKDMAVMVLVDESGSMNDGKSRTAAIATTLLGRALEISGKTFCICGFNDNFVIHKPWNEPMKTGEMLKIDLNADRSGAGYNNDGYAVRTTTEMLRKRPEESKILIVLSDGEPAPSMEYEQYDLATEVLESEKSVRVYSIGIEDHSVEEFYTNSVVIDHVDDLPKVLTDFFKSLVGKRSR